MPVGKRIYKQACSAPYSIIDKKRADLNYKKLSA
jgi:hypothetical protein